MPPEHVMQFACDATHAPLALWYYFAAVVVSALLLKALDMTWDAKYNDTTPIHRKMKMLAGGEFACSALDCIASAGTFLANHATLRAVSVVL